MEEQEVERRVAIKLRKEKEYKNEPLYV